MEINKGKRQSAQKVVVYGVEGIGKSTFASQFPEPLFSDTEGSTNALDVSRFQDADIWADLISQARYVKNNQPCATYIVDSIDWAERLCMEAICKEHGKKSIEDFGYGKGYTLLAEEFGKYLNLLQEIVDNGINVVLVAHSTIRKIERPDDENSYDRYELKLQKKTAPLVKEWCDMLLFANYQTYTQKTADGKVKPKGKQRMMYCTYSPVWDAKNRHGLPDELPFEFKQIKKLIPTFSKKEKAEKSKANNIAKIEAMQEEEHEDYVELKSKQDVIREELKKRDIGEDALLNFLNEKGLVKAKKLDDISNEDINQVAERLDKILDKIDDLPF